MKQGDVVRILGGWSRWMDKYSRATLHHAWPFEGELGIVAGTSPLNMLPVVRVNGMNIPAPEQYLQLVAHREDRKDGAEWKRATNE